MRSMLKTRFVQLSAVLILTLVMTSYITADLVKKRNHKAIHLALLSPSDSHVDTEINMAIRSPYPSYGKKDKDNEEDCDDEEKKESPSKKEIKKKTINHSGSKNKEEDCDQEDKEGSSSKKPKTKSHGGGSPKMVSGEGATTPPSNDTSSPSDTGSKGGATPNSNSPVHDTIAVVKPVPEGGPPAQDTSASKGAVNDSGSTPPSPSSSMPDVGSGKDSGSTPSLPDNSKKDSSFSDHSGKSIQGSAQPDTMPSLPSSPGIDSTPASNLTSAGSKASPGGAPSAGAMGSSPKSIDKSSGSMESPDADKPKSSGMDLGVGMSDKSPDSSTALALPCAGNTTGAALSSPESTSKSPLSGTTLPSSLTKEGPSAGDLTALGSKGSTSPIGASAQDTSLALSSSSGASSGDTPPSSDLGSTPSSKGDEGCDCKNEKKSKGGAALGLSSSAGGSGNTDSKSASVSDSKGIQALGGSVNGTAVSV